MTTRFLKATGKCLLIISSAAFNAFGQCGSDGLQKCPPPKPIQNPSSPVSKSGSSSTASRPKPSLMQATVKIPPEKLSPAAQQFVDKAKNCRAADDYDCAISNYTAAINLAPKSAVNYYMRADAYKQRAFSEKRSPEQKTSDLNAAFKDYAKCIELNPSEAGFYEDRARLYLLLDKQESALADYTTALRQNNSKKEQSYLYKSRANICENLDRFDEAIADQTKVINLDKTEYEIGVPDDYGKRARLYQKRASKSESAGKIKEAKDYYQLAINDLTEGSNYKIKEDPQKENFIRESIRKENFLTISKLYLKIDKPAEALNVLNPMISANPGVDRYYDARGDVYMALGKNAEQSGAIISPGLEYQAAAADYENALKFYGKDNFYLVYKLGTANLNGKKYDEAVKSFSEGIRLKPDDANLYDWRRLAYEKLGKTDLARADRLKFEQLKGGKTN